MERSEFLKKMRARTEAMYDHFAPAYWVTYGNYDNSAHCQFIGKFLERLKAGSEILDAGCGAGRFDGILVGAGHNVLGIDQSGGMLVRAREHFPQEQYPRLHYEKIGLQEMDFHAQFEGVVCLDALEHVPPEDWPGIVQRFSEALKPGGMLYVTVEEPEWDEVRAAYERARALGLPVVFGEVADKVDSISQHIAEKDPLQTPGEETDGAVYHFHPAMEQVQTWFKQVGLRIEEKGSGLYYAHLLARKQRPSSS
jgi:2-polyprenyl-3-methyl-5-hydroxy-6-metoxy-1,4-benzoquinol methylase